MRSAEVRPGIFWVGALDTVSEYFDNLMPLPDGTSYNSFLVRGGERVALVDGVDVPFLDQLFAHLDEAGVDRLDFIVANHAEQDHAGGLPRLLDRFPMALVVANEKCKHALQKELGLPDGRFMVIGDGDELSLGGKTLRFLFAPWVHWPETMFTYAVEDEVLFSCDLFGAHLAFDDLWASSREVVERPAKRYFAEIMMPFARMVQKHVGLVRSLGVSVIAPSHGPLYGDPDLILCLHEEWLSGVHERRVVVAYVTMHGSTRRMVEHLEFRLKERGVPCEVFDIMRADVGDVAMSLVNAGAFVVASPAYLGGLHPAAAHLLFLLNGFRPAVGLVGFLSSHGWEKGCGVDQVRQFLPRLQSEFLPPVLVEGFPDEEGFRRIDGLVEAIVGRL